MANLDEFEFDEYEDDANLDEGRCHHGVSFSDTCDECDDEQLEDENDDDPEC